MPESCSKAESPPQTRTIEPTKAEELTHAQEGEDTIKEDVSIPNANSPTDNDTRVDGKYEPTERKHSLSKMGPLSKALAEATTHRPKFTPPPVYPAGLHPLFGPDCKRKLLVLDKSGSGYLSTAPIDVEKETINWNLLKTVKCEELKGLREFACTVYKNKLYVFGGLLVDERRTVSKVKW